MKARRARLWLGCWACLIASAGAAQSGFDPYGDSLSSLDTQLADFQRKLKDAGRFVFFERTRGDASYLQYFVPTLEMVAGALSRLPERPELRVLVELVERQIAIGRSRGMLPA